MKIKTIESFSGEFRFLSNFFIEPDGSFVEKEYQMAKCVRLEDKKLFHDKSPVECKKIGRTVEMPHDWDEIKREIMFKLVYRKFRDHPSLLNLLIKTGNTELVEGNWWGDIYWGVCGGKGDNQLGKILMEVRDLLGKE